MKTKITSLLMTAGFIGLGFSQGFVNLDFESATFVPIAGDSLGRVQFAQAFPGWTGTVGGLSPDGVLSNNVYLSTAGFSMIKSNFNTFGVVPGGLIQGKFTAVLQSGTLTNTLNGVDTSLSQTGLVPIGTQSLQFKAYQAFDSSGSFSVSLGGQALSLFVLGGGANFTLYGVDITGFAGQTQLLNFSVPGHTPQSSGEYLYLDAIQFSTSAVPEPSPLALAGLSAALLACRGWRRK